MKLVFYISSAIAIISTVLVVTRRNAVHALLYLVISLISVGLIFFVIGAPFAAILEVIIYAGAIMVLFVFVVMMLNLGRAEPDKRNELLNPYNWLGPLVLMGIMAAELVFVLTSGQGLTAAEQVTPKQVGVALLGPYLLGVELASILLLVALVGVFHLGLRDYRGEEGRKE